MPLKGEMRNEKGEIGWRGDLRQCYNPSYFVEHS